MSRNPPNATPPTPPPDLLGNALADCFAALLTQLDAEDKQTPPTAEVVTGDAVGGTEPGPKGGPRHN